MTETLSFRVALGNFLPADNPNAPRAYAVLGSKLRSELFGDAQSRWASGSVSAASAIR